MPDQNKNLVVIPACNEEDALPPTIASLQSLPDDYEVLVVNDGSQDLTSQVAHELVESSRLPLHVVDLPLKCGIGVAMQTGYLFAAAHQTYDYVIQFDADGQHDAEAITLLVEACEQHDFDLCIGSRFLATGSHDSRTTVPRRPAHRFLSLLIKLLGSTSVTDPTSSFRCAGPRAWVDFASQYPDDHPEPESLYWCLRNQLRVGEIPVTAREPRSRRKRIRWLPATYYMLEVTLSIIIDMLRPKEDPLA